MTVFTHRKGTLAGFKEISLRSRERGELHSYRAGGCLYLTVPGNTGVCVVTSIVYMCVYVFMYVCVFMHVFVCTMHVYMCVLSDIHHLMML